MRLSSSRSEGESMVLDRCSACGNHDPGHGDAPVDGEWFCAPCERLYPLTILMAAAQGDIDGEYALGLSTGVEVRFSRAEVMAGGDFLRVRMTESFGASDETHEWLRIARGPGIVDIRVAEIVWCCER